MGVPIQGKCDTKFEAVKAAFQTNFEQFNDIGASVAITLDGEFVVDLWGGHLDSAKTDPWQEDTLVNVWSSTKTMAAMSLLLLADKGEVDLYAPAAKYWPELRRTGKTRSRCEPSSAIQPDYRAWMSPCLQTRFMTGNG